MFEGERTGTFWAGLIVLSLALVFLLGIMLLLSVEIPKWSTLLWEFWIIPPFTKLQYLTVPII